MRFLPTILFLGLCVVVPSLAEAAKPGRIDRVIVEGRDKTIEFTFTATTEIDGNRAEAIPAGKGRVLILRIGGVTAKRRWVKQKDKQIKRVLLHSSRKNKPAAILRVRFKKRVVNRELMKRIRVFIEDGGIRISVPRPGVPADLDIKKTAKTGTATVPVTRPTPGTQTGQNEVTFKVPDSTVDPGVKTPTAVAAATLAVPTTPTTKAPIEPVATTQTAPTVTATPAEQTAPTAQKKTTPPTEIAKKTPTPTPEDILLRKKREAAETSDTQAPDDPTPIMAGATKGAPPDAKGLIFMPGVRTRDILAGFTDLSLRLEKGLAEREGTHRIAVFPFLALDKKTKGSHVDAVSQLVMTDRLLKRPGVIQADPTLLARAVKPLKRDDMGRYDLDEARAAGVVVGADTLIIGTANSIGNGYVVDTRAVDIASGKRLGSVSQEFDGDAFENYVNRIRTERTYGGAMGRSAVLPGWGQLYQNQTERGAVYLALFSTTLLAGLVSTAAGAYAENEYRDSRAASDIELRETANERYAQANAFFVTSGLVWLAAMVDTGFSAKNVVTIDPARYGAEP